MAMLLDAMRERARAGALYFVLSLGPCVGCAPALSSFTPAHVAPKGHVQAELGLDVSVPTGAMGHVVDAGEALSAAGDQRELTREEQEQLLRSGAALLLNPPSATPHFGIAYTAWERIELNGRLSAGAIRLGARYQLLQQAKSGVDVSVGLGGARYAEEFPIGNQLSLLKVEGFTRWQLDLPLLVGRHENWYRVWAGPRVLFGFYDTGFKLEQPALPGVTNERTVHASLDGVATYLGAQAGAAVGYKRVFLALELTVAKLWTSSDLVVDGTLHELELDGAVVYPGVGLLFEF